MQRFRLPEFAGEFDNSGRPIVFARMDNNPKGEPTGHYTGRCMKCGSKNLWDDFSAYGCNDCDEVWVIGQ